MKKVLYLAVASALLLSFTVVNGIQKEEKSAEHAVAKKIATPEIVGVFTADRNQFK